MNFYIANDVVLVPVFDDVADLAACDTLGACFPAGKFIPCGRSICVGTGGLSLHHAAAAGKLAAERAEQSASHGVPRLQSGTDRRRSPLFAAVERQLADGPQAITLRLLRPDVEPALTPTDKPGRKYSTHGLAGCYERSPLRHGDSRLRARRRRGRHASRQERQERGRRRKHPHHRPVLHAFAARFPARRCVSQFFR